MYELIIRGNGVKIKEHHISFDKIPHRVWEIEIHGVKVNQGRFNYQIWTKEIKPEDIEEIIIKFPKRGR